MKLNVQKHTASYGVAVTALAWCSGREVATVSDDHTLRMWNTSGDACVRCRGEHGPLAQRAWARVVRNAWVGC